MTAFTGDEDGNTYTTVKTVFGSYSYPLNTIQVHKYNEQGKKLWNKKVNYNIITMELDKYSNKLYYLVKVDSFAQIGKVYYRNPWDTISSQRYSLILVKSDTALNIEWSRLISDSINFLTGGASELNAKMKITSSDILIQYTSVIGPLSSTNTPLYYYPYFRFKNKLNLLNYNKVKNGDIGRIILKLDKSKSSSNNEWCMATVGNGWPFIKNASGNNAHSDEDFVVDTTGHIYINFYNRNYIYIDTTLYEDTLNGKNRIFKISTSTKQIVKTFNFDFDIDAFTVDLSGRLIVSGRFQSQMNYRGTAFNTISGYYSTVLLFLDVDGEKIWAIQEKNQNQPYGLYFGELEYKNGNIFIRGSLGKVASTQHAVETNFAGKNILTKWNRNGSTIGERILGKIDTTGYCSWLFPYSTSPTSYVPTKNYSFDVRYLHETHVDKNNGVYYAEILPYGNYTYTHIIDTPIAEEHQTVIFKLITPEIILDTLAKINYCEGDTFKIRYSLHGRFKSTNNVIAQISDENGKFIGLEKEIGRVTGNKDSIIIGKIPNIANSGKYKFRVITTEPKTQVIGAEIIVYSRDSANAGNDTIVCRGQSVQLSTTGGSKWQWSPAESLDDSTLFKPIASPKVDTRYRIIISDSSGCGDTDTDYVWVRLRQPLDILAPFTDSTICRGQITKLFATGFGGDSTNYSISWYEREANGDVLLNQNIDSISISNSSSTKTFFAVLTDNCTTKPDTQLYTINILAPLKTSIVDNRNDTLHLADTLICYDTDLKLYAYSTGGRVSTRTISWYDTGFIATADAVLVPKAQPQKYYAILKDNCTILADTAVIEVMQRLPLSIIIQANDSVCSRNPLQLNATLNGGDSTQYQVNWHASNTSWTSNQNPTLHIPNSTTTYIATISDNCSPTVSDSIKVNVYPIPAPQFTFDNTYGCPPLQVQYVDKSKGNIGTNNRWVVDNGAETTNANTSKQFSKTALTTAKLITINQFGCTDSITKSEQVNVFQKPQAQFVANPARLEVEETITFTSTSKEAIKYQWDLGDGILSYDNGTVKRTFYNEGEQNIILVAENSLGCKDTAYKTIRIFDKVYCAIPNAFTPNGDGLNNVFAPVCEGINDYTLTIYSRWGQVIHQSRNGAWDGMYDGKPVPQGVYMYKIHIHAQSKNKSMVYGSVNVIR